MVLALTQQLIEQPSITPDDKQCQSIIAERLKTIGFSTESLPFGRVSNLWARRGTTQPCFVFAGHTDVVPTGPLEQWHSPPFLPSIRGEYLYGRGTVDMKGAIAAFIVACEQFVSKHPHHQGSIALLITSDEEGPAVDGTKRVIETLQSRGEKIDYCVVGEPSSTKSIGDCIKIGRRGSLSGRLTIYGKQGHIAYPQRADNPIHKSLLALHCLCEQTWDQGNIYFPASSFQISTIHAGTGANNVIPGEMTVDFNFRYCTENNAETLITTVEALLNKHSLNYAIDWHHSGQPFLTSPGKLIDAALAAIAKHSDSKTECSTSGGTSDARFIAPTGAEVIELGLVNQTLHQIDECVRISDLDDLSAIYYSLLENLLCII